MSVRTTIALPISIVSALLVTVLIVTVVGLAPSPGQATNVRVEPLTVGSELASLEVAERLHRRSTVAPPTTTPAPTAPVVTNPPSNPPSNPPTNPPTTQPPGTNPPSTTPPVDVSPSGVSAPRGDLPGWRQLFVDDFTTDIPLGSFPQAVDDQWRAYPSPWRDTSKNGQYTPERVVSVADGVLNKHLHTENGVHMVAALTPKINDTPKFGTLYGRYEIRFRVDRLIPDYKIAWLLWPDVGTNITGSPSGVGGNGEIDFPEMDLDDDAVSAFVHYQDATRRDDQSWAGADVDILEWHTYTIEWSPNLVVFLLDGVEIGRTTERVPNTSMHWVIQTETSLSTEPADHVQGNVLIDWVAMWEYDPTTR